jgi:hypothetical protein
MDLEDRRALLQSIGLACTMSAALALSRLVGADGVGAVGVYFVIVMLGNLAVMLMIRPKVNRGRPAYTNDDDGGGGCGEEMQTLTLHEETDDHLSL